MSKQDSPPSVEFGDLGLCDRSSGNRAGDGTHVVTAESLLAAQARLASAAAESRRLRIFIDQVTYYGVPRPQSEETIGDITSELDAVITRNHYGCLVLNAARTLFIDVDFVPPRPERATTDTAEQRQPSWESMLADLSLVLRHEEDIGFRIYRTKAGFRLLATNLEFEPDSPRAKKLMKTVSADADFVQLCRIQKNFRARLTPKPWRCGAKRPPNFYPRISAAQRRAFSEWLTQYEHACRARATCQYLGHIGPCDVHQRIAPVVELHDRETKAFQSLALA